MSQLIACPYCKAPVEDDGSLAGEAVYCPRCGGQFRMPEGNPYAITTSSPSTPHVRSTSTRKRAQESGLGIASFVVAFVADILLLSGWLVEIAYVRTHPLEVVVERAGAGDGPLHWLAYLHFSLFGWSLLGIALGIGALFQRDRSYRAAWIGIVGSAIPVLIVLVPIIAEIAKSLRH